MTMVAKNELCTILLALAISSGGCATIAGTAVSPITGGVDLTRRTLSARKWYLAPAVFIGGAIAGPFVAIYNGVGYDADVFDGFEAYWKGFDQVFRPFEMIVDR